MLHDSGGAGSLSNSSFATLSGQIAKLHSAKSLLKNRSNVQKSTPVVSKSTVVVFKTYGVKSEVILINLCYLYRESSKVI